MSKPSRRAGPAEEETVPYVPSSRQDSNSRIEVNKETRPTSMKPFDSNSRQGSTRLSMLPPAENSPRNSPSTRRMSLQMPQSQAQPSPLALDIRSGTSIPESNAGLHISIPQTQRPLSIAPSTSSFKSTPPVNANMGKTTNPRRSMAQNALTSAQMQQLASIPVAPPMSNYHLDLNEDYLFYSNPGSRRTSISDTHLIDEVVISLDASIRAHGLGSPKEKGFAGLRQKEAALPALYNPLVRAQLKKLKTHQPWFLGTVTLIQIGVMIAEFVVNYRNTGSVIETNPFNYMIGPTTGVLTLFGGRFVPCMKPGTGFDVAGAEFECPPGIIGSFANGATCSLADVCIWGGFPTGAPDQWFRFIVPIFLHGGIVHIAFNLALQIQAGFSLEKDIGWWRMGLIYMISGVGGFAFGAFLGDIRYPSVGASGSLYGIVACLLLDLIQNWSLVKNPWKELAFMIIEVLISFLIGTLPYVDNFAHFGGFVTGIFAGFLLMPKIYFTEWDKRRKIFFMAICLPAMIAFVTYCLLTFYTGTVTCEWCQYLNCIPGMPWCADKGSSLRYCNLSLANCGA